MSQKPILVEGWNPFHTDARYGLPATFVLLFAGYVGVSLLLKKREQLAPAVNGFGAYLVRR